MEVFVATEVWITNCTDLLSPAVAGSTPSATWSGSAQTSMSKQNCPHFTGTQLGRNKPYWKLADFDCGFSSQNIACCSTLIPIHESNLTLSVIHITDKSHSGSNFAHTTIDIILFHKHVHLRNPSHPNSTWSLPLHSPTVPAISECTGKRSKVLSRPQRCRCRSFELQIRRPTFRRNTDVPINLKVNMALKSRRSTSTYVRMCAKTLQTWKYLFMPWFLLSPFYSYVSQAYTVPNLSTVLISKWEEFGR
jgi:hypothetical protein